MIETSEAPPPPSASPDSAQPSPAPVSPAPPRKRPGIVGAANVVFYCVLAVIWAWIPLGLFFGGLGGLTALGSGLVLLFAWLYVQRGTNYASYWWAELVYRRGYQVPRFTPSPYTGFKGYWHKQWLILKSWTFWRTTLYHYVKMLYAVLVCILCFIVLIIGTGLIVGSLDLEGPVEVSFGIPLPEHRPTTLRIIFGIVGTVLVLGSFVALWFSAYVDRKLDEWFLPPTEAEVLRAEVTTLEGARAGAVDAATTERLRIERDLHDGVQPMLVSLSMKLGMAKSKLNPDAEGNPKDSDGARELVTEAHADSKEAITELRQLARGIHPAVLDDRGLDAAISALAARSAIPTRVQVDLPQGFSAGSEADSVAYFVIAESLTNAGKHSNASHVEVRVGLLPDSSGAAGQGVPAGSWPTGPLVNQLPSGPHAEQHWPDDTRAEQHWPTGPLPPGTWPGGPAQGGAPYGGTGQEGYAEHGLAGQGFAGPSEPGATGPGANPAGPTTPPTPGSPFGTAPGGAAPSTTAPGGAPANGPQRLQIVITDNGSGGASLRRDGSGTGLAGLHDRVAAAKGTFSLTSPVGGPTTIAVEVPCA